MRWRHSLTSRLRSLFWRANAEDHLDEEIRFHLERQVEHNVAAGMEPDEARRAARREFGGVAQVQEHCRDAWGVRFLDEIRGDLRHAARSLIQSRGLSAAVVVTLALGIGVNAAIFSLIDAVLLRSLPVQSPDELFVVAVRAGSYPMFQDLEEAVAGEAVLFASDGGSEFEVRFLGESAEALPERVLVEMATGRFSQAWA